MLCAFLSQKCSSLGDDAKLSYILGLLQGDFEQNGNLARCVVKSLKNATDEQLARIEEVLYHGKSELARDIDYLIFEHKLDKDHTGFVVAANIFTTACAVGVDSIVQAFLRNPDFDFVDIAQTALALAASHKQLAVLKLLVADNRLTGQHFANMLPFVVESRDSDLVKFFFNCQRFPVTQIQPDILETSLDSFKELLALLDGKPLFDFQTMLANAVKYKKQDYVEYIVENQNVDLAAYDHLVFREAAKRNYTEIFDFLLTRLAAGDCDCHRTIADLHTDSQKRKRKREEGMNEAVAARIAGQKRLWRDKTVYYWDPKQLAFFEGVLYLSYVQDGVKMATVNFSNGTTRNVEKENDLMRELPEAKEQYAVGDRVLVRRMLACDKGVVSWWPAVVKLCQGDRYLVEWTCELDDGENEEWMAKHKEMRPNIEKIE